MECKGGSIPEQFAVSRPMTGTPGTRSGRGAARCSGHCQGKRSGSGRSIVMRSGWIRISGGELRHSDSTFGLETQIERRKVS
jgi:hypothetical protein